VSEAVRAVFVDRDGTIIRDEDYLADPEQVALLPGAVEGLTVFRNDGYEIVIVTNQSGIARGFYGEGAYRAVQQELERKLAAHGLDVLDAYHCPHHPDFTGPCTCRKPAPGLFLRAAEDHGIDLARSIYVGDRIRDVEPGVVLGGLGILVRTGYGDGEAPRAPPEVRVVADLAAAGRLARTAGRPIDTHGDEKLT
jgi:D-glycero-D-manno-heptose 1,7-bisphosphate phosphatase